MPEENNITPNENEEIVIPTTGVITDVKFGANGEPYEIGLGESTREAIEAMFDAVDYNFTQLNNELEGIQQTIDDNEETVSSALNDLEERKLDAANVPDVSNYFDDAVFDSSTNRINFKNGNTVKKYIDTTDIFDSDDYYTKVEIDEADKTIASALNDLETNKADIVDVPLLYNTTGSATDGAMTQNAVTQALQSFNCGEY